METVEWTGGQIHDDDSAEDIKNVDLTKVWTAFSLSACAAVAVGLHSTHQDLAAQSQVLDEICSSKNVATVQAACSYYG